MLWRRRALPARAPLRPSRSCRAAHHRSQAPRSRGPRLPSSHSGSPGDSAAPSSTDTPAPPADPLAPSSLRRKHPAGTWSVSDGAPLPGVNHASDDLARGNTRSSGRWRSCFVNDRVDLLAGAAAGQRPPCHVARAPLVSDSATVSPFEHRRRSEIVVALCARRGRTEAGSLSDARLLADMSPIGRRRAERLRAERVPMDRHVSEDATGASPP